MPKIEITPTILCGGSGVRLWPLSRAGFPKQFHCLTGNESLFQMAVQRLNSLGTDDINVSKPVIIGNEEHRFLIAEQLRETDVETCSVLLEPNGRNTAPALTLAALETLKTGNDTVLVVTPADQMVKDQNALTSSLQTAILEAFNGSIVILGVTPDRPAVGFGYIQVDTGEEAKSSVLEVRRFVEKPDTVTAQAYLDNGNYYWNAGIFVLKASVWLQVLEHFRPDILVATRLAWKNRITDENFIRPGKDEFSAIPAESIDIAVAERCPNSRFPIKMIPLNAGWSDLGTWDAVWQMLPKDENGNAHSGDVLVTNSTNTLVHASSRLISLIGVNNLIVVETPDAVLILEKSFSQEVKTIVNALNTHGRGEHSLHRKVHRPWGWYDSIDEGGRFKVKRIQVKPKASLSLQKHFHRAEHWIVVKGTAEITNGEKVIILSENQSTYIPLGEVHRLANPGNMPLEIIEVQTGSYLEEDDIVRFEDDYGRIE